MSRVEIYTKRWCAFCQMAKSLLGRTGLAFEEYDVTSDPGREREMKERSGRHTVPQVFIDGRPVGGYAELSELHATGRLGDPPAGGGTGEQG